MARYPSDDSRFARWLRPFNILDDQDNKLSPTKFNLWGANLSTLTTVGATIFAWIGNHVDMLDHILSIAPLVAGHLTQAHIVSHYDKKLMKDQS